MQRIQMIETLTLREQFRLVEIAHETKDRDVKREALSILNDVRNPLDLSASDTLSGGE